MWYSHNRDAALLDAYQLGHWKRACFSSPTILIYLRTRHDKHRRYKKSRPLEIMLSCCVSPHTKKMCERHKVTFLSLPSHYRLLTIAINIKMELFHLARMMMKFWSLSFLLQAFTFIHTFFSLSFSSFTNKCFYLT